MNTAPQDDKMTQSATPTPVGPPGSYPQPSDGLYGPSWCNCGGGFVCPECRR